MALQIQPRSRRMFGIVAAGAALLMSFGPVTRYVNGDPTGPSKTSPAFVLAGLGFKFNGSGSCAGSGCHSDPGADTPPKAKGHELTIWKKSDMHAKAYDTLTKNKLSAEIGAAVKIADVKTSDRCLSCHALNVTDSKLKGATYSIREGNTCESCHGPSEKWLKEHTDAKWQDAERLKGHDVVLKEIGLYDTRPLLVRAELCASCHLAIDADLVAAKHPPTSFELAYYSDIEPKHWSETHFKSADGFVNTKIWIAGQVVCLREGMQQLSKRVTEKASADLISSAWQQAMAHASVFQPAAGAIGLDAAALDTHIKALAALKPDAGEKIVAEANAIADICKGIDAQKFEAWQPDNAATASALKSVAGLTGLGTYGAFGVDQQTMAISSLYNAWTSGNNKPAKDEVSKLINETLFPDNPIPPADLDKAVATVKAKLPQ